MSTINSIVLADNAYGTLSSGLLVGDTTLTFTSGHGARFPAVTSGQSLYCVLLNNTNVLEEIIITLHTAGADSCTISRAAGDTTAKAWSAGDRIEARISSSLLAAMLPAAAIATQTDQETATSVTTTVTPGRQQYHPSAAKVWAMFGVAGDIAASYNMTSVTDDGAGLARVIWATDFSSTSYAAIPALTNDATSAATTLVASITWGSKTVTQCQVQSTRVTDGTHIDPNEGYNFVAYGDQ